MNDWPASIDLTLLSTRYAVSVTAGCGDISRCLPDRPGWPIRSCAPRDPSSRLPQSISDLGLIEERDQKWKCAAKRIEISRRGDELA